MKYKIIPSKKFSKQVKKYEKSGKFNILKLKKTIELLAEDKPLSVAYNDHNLKGDLKNFRECHIEPDLLLIYQKIDKKLILNLVKIGSHAELF